MTAFHPARAFTPEMSKAATLDTCTHAAPRVRAQGRAASVHQAHDLLYRMLLGPTAAALSNPSARCTTELHPAEPLTGTLDMAPLPCPLLERYLCLAEWRQ